MNQYQKKQFTIATIFILIVVVVGFGIYFLVKPSPTCFDGIQNQGETGIDCGGPKCGPCEEAEELVVISADFIPTFPSDFDLVAKIRNPNPDWGIETMDYKFNIYGSDNELIGYKTGKTYVLPQETKYIIEQRMTTEIDPFKADIELSNIIWQELKDFEEIEIGIKDKRHEITEQGFNKVSGNIENKSSYDLVKIEINGLLFDENDKLIAVGKTETRAILTGESRYFEIIWPYQVPEEISSFEIRAYTNIFLYVHLSP